MLIKVRLRGVKKNDNARLIVILKGEALEVDQLKYLSSVLAESGGVEADVSEWYKVLGELKGVIKYRGLRNSVKFCMKSDCADCNV